MVLSCTCFTMNLYFFFSTSSNAFSLRISCMYMARNHNYSTAVLFLLHTGFYKILNKVVY